MSITRDVYEAYVKSMLAIAPKSVFAHWNNLPDTVKQAMADAAMEEIITLEPDEPMSVGVVATAAAEESGGGTDDTAQ
jgi:tRNA(Met) C34 N-acetyltransferase TmcA